LLVKEVMKINIDSFLFRIFLVKLNNHIQERISLQL